MGNFLNVSDVLSVELDEYKGNPSIRLYVSGAKPVSMGFAKLQTILLYRDELENIMRQNPGAETHVERATRELKRNRVEMGVVEDTPEPALRLSAKDVARINAVANEEQSDIDKKIARAVTDALRALAPQFAPAPVVTRETKDKKLRALPASNPASVKALNGKIDARAKEMSKDSPTDAEIRKMNSDKARKDALKITSKSAQASASAFRGTPLKIAFIVKGKRVSKDVPNKSQAIDTLASFGIAREYAHEVRARNGSPSHEFDALVNKGFVEILNN